MATDSLNNGDACSSEPVKRLNSKVCAYMNGAWVFEGPCGDCPECRQAPICEREWDSLRAERDRLREALSRVRHILSGPSFEPVRTLAAISDAARRGLNNV